MLMYFPNPRPSKVAAAVIKQRSMDQAEANKLYYKGYTEEAEAELRRLAIESANEYESYGPEWVLGEAMAVVDVRGEVRARPGDIVLLSQDLAGVVLFYSVRIAHRCVAGAGIKPIMGWDQAFLYWRSQAGRPKTALVVDLTEEEPVPEVFGEIPELPARSEGEGDIRED